MIDSAQEYSQLLSRGTDQSGPNRGRADSRVHAAAAAADDAVTTHLCALLTDADELSIGSAPARDRRHRLA